MLLNRRALDGIASGTINVAFRRWIRPTVRTGGTLRSRVGLLAIDSVRRIDEADISEDDARAAGAISLQRLLAQLSSRAEGDLYRIDFHLAGPDPRIALREDDDVSDQALEHIRVRLARLDAASNHGAWTSHVLRMIEAQPGERAPNLASSMGMETQPFKRDVRKLKELGLTESLKVGYRLSPRGRKVLDRLTP